MVVIHKHRTLRQYHRLRNRWYSPSLGRFNLRDPYRIKKQDLINLYKGFENRPIEKNDPSGLMAMAACPVVAALDALFTSAGISIVLFNSLNEMLDELGENLMSVNNLEPPGDCSQDDYNKLRDAVRNAKITFRGVHNR